MNQSKDSRFPRVVASPGFRELNWKFPALPENVEKVCHLAGQELNTLRLHKNDHFAIILLLREALNNAVLHGCSQDPALSFSCQLMISKDEVLLEVSDEGPGFDWRSRLAQAESEPPEDTDESGRGLPIFRRYATATFFNEAGNCVRLTRKITQGVSNE